MLLRLSQLGIAPRLAALSFFLWGIGEGLWLYIQPLYPESLGANPEQVGLALAMLGIGRMVAILPFVWALSHFSPRYVMIPGYLSGVLGAIILALAPTWEWTTLGLWTYGLSSATMIPASVYFAALAKTQESSLHTIMSSIWAANALGIIISPSIGGFLGAALGLRSVFAFSAFWFLVAVLPILACPDYPAEQNFPFSRENLQLFKNRSFLWRNGLFTLILVIAPLGYALAPQYLEEVHGYTTPVLGVLGTLSAGGIAFWSLFLGQQKVWTSFWFGQILLCLGLSIFLLTAHPLGMGLAYFLYGVWYAFRPFMTTLISEIIPLHQQGFAFAIIDLLYGVSSALAPLAAGILYARQTNLPIFVALLSSLAVLSLTSWYMTQRNLMPRRAYSKAYIFRGK